MSRSLWSCESRTSKTRAARRSDPEAIGAGRAADQDESFVFQEVDAPPPARARPSANDGRLTPRPARCRRCDEPSTCEFQERRFSRMEKPTGRGRRGPRRRPSGQRAGPRAANAIGRAGHQRGTLEEIGNAQPAREARRARSRQHMVGAGDIVADRLGRVAPRKIAPAWRIFVGSASAGPASIASSTCSAADAIAMGAHAARLGPRMMQPFSRSCARDVGARSSS